MIDRVTINQVSTAALGDVMIIMTEAFDPYFGEAWTASQCAGILSIPGSWLCLARIDNKPAGFMLVRSVVDEAELLLIAVRPCFQGQMLGQTLLGRLIADCRAQKIRTVHLEVRADNRAIVFYRHAGFEQVGSRKDYYRSAQGRLTDAITLSKSLL
jgi:[ribosomal protein S18]-alanine N-acetyltransferase